MPLDALPRLGHDPELPADAQELVAVAWRKLTEVADDAQGARVLANLTDRDLS